MAGFDGAVFGTPPWRGDGSLRVLSDVPDGAGPLIAAVRVAQQAGGEVPTGALELADLTVFRLADPLGREGTPAAGSAVVDVAGLAEVGSELLAAAL